MISYTLISESRLVLLAIYTSINIRSTNVTQNNINTKTVNTEY